MNTNRFPSTPSLIFTLLLILLAFSGPASADDTGWKIRVGAIWVDPDVNVDTIDDAGARARAESVDDINLDLGLEFRFSRRLGLDFGVAFAQPKVGLTVDFPDGGRVSAIDSIDFTPITAALNIHLTPDRRADLYIGPMIGYVLYGNLGFDAGSAGRADFSSSDDFALGAQLGVDVGIGDGPWSFDAALRYLDTNLEVTGEDGDRTELGFEPIMFRMGIGYRF